MIKSMTNRQCSTYLHMKSLGRSREYRYKSNQYLCDGIKLLGEAIQSDVSIKTVLFTDCVSNEVMKLLRHYPDTECFTAKQDIIDSVSPLKNAQNVVFVCEMKSAQPKTIFTGNHLLLDKIQDPGNIGAILRSADAFCADSVLLLDSSVDPYNPKAIRASMGALFRQKFTFISIDELKCIPLPIYSISADKSAPDISLMPSHSKVLAIGNEGSGVSDEILSFCAGAYTISHSETTESLNTAVAASIVLWELSKCRK